MMWCSRLPPWMLESMGLLTQDVWAPEHSFHHMHLASVASKGKEQPQTILQYNAVSRPPPSTKIAIRTMSTYYHPVRAIIVAPIAANMLIPNALGRLHVQLALPSFPDLVRLARLWQCIHYLPSPVSHVAYDRLMTRRARQSCGSATLPEVMSQKRQPFELLCRYRTVERCTSLDHAMASGYFYFDGCHWIVTNLCSRRAEDHNRGRQRLGGNRADEEPRVDGMSLPAKGAGYGNGCHQTDRVACGRERKRRRARKQPANFKGL